MFLVLTLLACGSGDKDTAPTPQTGSTTSGSGTPTGSTTVIEGARMSVTATRRGQFAGLGLGSAVACGPDLTGEGGPDVVVSAPDVFSKATKKGPTGGEPSQIFVLHGTSQGDQVLSSTTALFLGDPDWPMGRSVAVLPDQDGDGLGEVAATLSNYPVGPDPFAALRHAVPGATELLPHQATGLIGDQLTNAATSVVALPDLGSDGTPDLGIGLPSHVFVVEQALVGSDPTGAQATEIVDPGNSAFFGRWMAAGDLDADGEQELVIGTDGAALIYAGSDLTGAPIHTVSHPDDGFEARVAVAELTGDGVLDLVIHDPSGRTAVWFGPVLQAQGAPDLELVPQVTEPFDGGLALAADLDGDGQSDLVVSDSRCNDQNNVWCDPGEPGQVRAWRGPIDATTDAQTPTWYWTGPEPMDGAGHALAACDLDGDGADELVVGAPGTRNGQGTLYGAAAGAVYWIAP